MVLALLLVLLAIILALSLINRGQVPWSNKLRRVHPGVSQRAEWMAPETVVQQVHSDYLAAIHWLYNSQSGSWAEQWASARTYLAGAVLEQHCRLMTQRLDERKPRLYEVMQANHDVSVRLFSEDGGNCLVVDRQWRRCVSLYDPQSRELQSDQPLNDSALVYQMCYDRRDKRWKIHTFIQELPIGWGHPQFSRRVRLLTALPTTVGRDS